MASNTSITDMMNLSVIRFYETWQAIRSVNERRRKAYEELKNS